MLEKAEDQEMCEDLLENFSGQEVHDNIIIRGMSMVACFDIYLNEFLIILSSRCSGIFLFL